MALVVFMRGINVGGRRRLRPSLLARALAAFDVVNIGAAGTFVVRKPGRPGAFVAALRRRLPFDARVIVCDGRELERVAARDPFSSEPMGSDTVRFMSVLSRPVARRVPVPLALPDDGEWLVRVVAADKRFVFGLYRRHMKTIGYLGKLDTLFGSEATTRNWNTVAAVVDVLVSGRAPRRGRTPSRRRRPAPPT